MATDYTVIRNSDLKNTADVVIEYIVPAAGNNTAGIQWRTVVAEVRANAGESGTANPRKRTDTAYLASLDSGAVLELAHTVEYDANLTTAQKATALDAAVTTKIAEFTTDFQNIYQFYGIERSV